MLSPLRNRFGIPGAISVVALVFAMLGGAWAAGNSGKGATTSAKVKAKRALRGPKGLTGPQGPVGPRGPAGVNGKDGVNGSDGTPGADGGSLVTREIEIGEVDCNGFGGIEVEAEGSGQVEKVCNGEEGMAGAAGAPGPAGSPWTAGGTLPVGATETGTWTVNSGGLVNQLVIGAISFPIPLAAVLDSSHVHYSTEANFADFDQAGPGTVGCAGTTAVPTAPSGNLCVYKAASVGTFASIAKATTPTNTTLGADVSGAAINFKTAAPNAGVSAGTWAVTG